MADKFDKDFDLEPTEYRREDQPEPFLGYNGKEVIILFLASFPVGAVAVRVIYGEWPYWVVPVINLLLGK